MVLCIAVLSLAAPVFPVNAYAKEEAISASKTLDKLLAAYAGEINAHNYYLAFAKKADEEGYGQVASLFRAVALAEQVHVDHYAAAIKSLGGIPKANIGTPVVKSTKENLKWALSQEDYLSAILYAGFAKQAEKDKIKIAINSFKGAEASEAAHAKLFKKALDNLQAWKGQKKDFFVCQVCGNVTEDKAPAICPICGAPKEKFTAVN
jgi:rubrerythrin